jgi:DNA repair protein RadC
LQHPQDKVAIHSSESAVNFLQPILQDIAHEVFCVVYLNRANKIIKHELVSSGGLTATIVDVRIILKQAILEQAVGVIVAHNHPSGNATPSEADNLITKKLKQALEQVDIKLLDHIIIAGTNSYSYADDNML